MAAAGVSDESLCQAPITPPYSMSEQSNQEYRSWPKRYEKGGWSTRRRRITVAAGSSPERGFGKQRRLWSFKTKVRVTALVLFLIAGCGAGLAWLLTRETEPKVVAGPAAEVTPEFSETASKERWVGPSPRKIVDAFLEASFEGGRHATRVAMIDALEG